MPLVIPLEQYRTASGRAIASSLRFAPECSSHPLSWANMEMLAWSGNVDWSCFESYDAPVIVYHAGGASKIRFFVDNNRQIQESHRGSVTVIPMNMKINWRVFSHIRSYSLHLSEDWFENSREGASGDVNDALKCCFNSQDPLLLNLMIALAGELESPSGMGSIYAETLAESVMLHIARMASRGGAIHPVAGLSARELELALEAIESHIEEGASLRALADAVGRSRGHFAIAFRKATGVPPHRYLINRRVAIAKEMLANTRRPVCDIALACGFSSQAHFTERFRRETGLTPMQYRNENRRFTAYETISTRK